MLEIRINIKDERYNPGMLCVMPMPNEMNIDGDEGKDTAVLEGYRFNYKITEQKNDAGEVIGKTYTSIKTRNKINISDNVENRQFKYNISEPSEQKPNIPDKNNNINSGFEELNKNDNEQSNEQLGENISYNFLNGTAPKSEQANLILSNFYKKGLKEGQVGIPENKYHTMNEFGKQIARKDGKISVNELKEMDTNGDNKLNQQEINAKKKQKLTNQNLTLFITSCKCLKCFLLWFLAVLTETNYLL